MLTYYASSLLGVSSSQKLFADGEKNCAFHRCEKLFSRNFDLFGPFITLAGCPRKLNRTQLENKDAGWIAKLGMKKGNTLTMLFAELIYSKT